MTICKNCNKEFPKKITIGGEIYNLSGRKFCPSCSPIGSRNTRSYVVKLSKIESFCSRCKKIKNKDEFYLRKNNSKPFSYCIDCQEEIKQLKFDEKLDWIIQLRGGCCQDCGNTFPAPIYEFYSSENIFYISKARNMSLEKLIEQLENYIMLCRNCCAIRKWENKKI